MPRQCTRHGVPVAEVLPLCPCSAVVAVLSAARCASLVASANLHVQNATSAHTERLMPSSKATLRPLLQPDAPLFGCLNGSQWHM